MNKKITIFTIIISLIIIIIYTNYPKKITLTLGIFAGSYWDVPSGNSYEIFDQAIKRFEQTHPNVEVTYVSGIRKNDYPDWLADKIVAGDTPDVFMIPEDDFTSFATIGVLKNLDSLMRNDSSFDETKYYSNALLAGVSKNHSYALPYEGNPQLMFVNKTLLNKEGIKIPDKWTIDDFYNICKAISKDSNNDGVIDQFGVYQYEWIDAINAYHAPLFDNEGKQCYIASDEAKKAILFVKQLIALNQGYQLSSHQFDHGQIAFSPMSFAQYRTYKPYPWKIKKYTGIEWDCIEMPSIDGENSNSINYLMAGINAKTSHEQLAWELLKQLTYDETTQLSLFELSQGISPLINVTNSDKTMTLLNADYMGESEIDMSLLDQVMEKAKITHTFKKYPQAFSMLSTSIHDLLSSDDDLDLALMNLSQQINQYLKE